MSDPDDQGVSFTDLLAKTAGKLGFSETTIRWKLLRLQQWWQRAAAGSAVSVAHVRYQHAVCRNCTRVNDRNATHCTGCEQPLGARAWQLLDRLGVALPVPASMSSVLGLLMVVVYARVMLASGGSFWSLDWEVLLRHGMHVPQLEQQGEWWRLATSVFLHAGLMHIGFNLMALAQIGPAIEELFGRGVMLFVFVVTGIAGMVGSAVLSGNPTVGASGAVMGLVGMAAGWGQRDGTAIGRSMRDRMLKWALYVTVFGMMMGSVDHAAHWVGLAAGAVFGWSVNPRWVEDPANHVLVKTLAAIGAAIALGAVSLCLFPPGR